MRPGAELACLVEPMLAGMMATRQHLMAWVHAHGLAALDALFRDEAVALAGPKGQHQAARTHHHWGTTATELTFGGRRLQVRRPRVRGTERPARRPCRPWPRSATRDPLSARMMQQLLVGVSTRNYEASLEPRPAERRTRGSSKSAVSRALVRRTRQRLQEHLTRRLEGLEVIALFVDGIVVAQQTAIVALGITRDGRKEPLGVSLGSTENAVVCTELLQDLLARGLTIDGRVLCVIDGGKGLRKALGDVFGDAAVIQRCQLHKARNLEALVPKARQVYVRAALRRAYRAASMAAARRQLTALVTLAGDEWPGRRGGQSAGGAGGDAHGAEAGAAAHAAPVLRDHELHREPDRHAAPRESQREALARGRHAAALAGPRAAARGRALPPDQAPRRARHARDRARPLARSRSRPREPSCPGDAEQARATTGSGSIFSRGGAMSLSPRMR